MFENFTIYHPGLQPLRPALILKIKTPIEMKGALVKAIEDFGKNDEFAFWVADREKNQGGLVFTLWNDAYRAVGSEIDSGDDKKSTIEVAFYKTYVQDLPIDGLRHYLGSLKRRIISIKDIDIDEVSR